MAQNPNPRRFYIDHGDDQPVVRAVPVRTAAPANDTAATHQVVPAPVAASPAKTLAARARRAPKTVSRLVQSARKHTHSPQS